MLTHKNQFPVKPSRVLILGAGGFLAPEIARVLQANDIAVHAIGSKEIDLATAGAASKLATEIRKDDVVVMVAALTPDKGRDIGTLMTNLRMAESVCAALGTARPEQFIYISSDSVYDARLSSLLNEESSCEPMDLYCLMHTARELLLRNACQGAKFPLAIVRPCPIYGSADTHNSYGPNRFIRTALKDHRIILFGGGEERRHHVFVTDVAELIQLCILHCSSGVINAITGEAVSFSDLADKTAAQLNGQIAIEQLPRANPITHRHYDTTLLAKAFPGFMATPLDVGLARTAAGM